MAAAQATPVVPPVPAGISRPPSLDDPDVLAQVPLIRQRQADDRDRDWYENTMALMDGYALRPDDEFAITFRRECDPTLTTDPASCGIDGPPEAPDTAFAAAMAAVVPTKKHERVVVTSPAPLPQPAQLASRTDAINAASVAVRMPDPPFATPILTWCQAVSSICPRMIHSIGLRNCKS